MEQSSLPVSQLFIFLQRFGCDLLDPHNFVVFSLLDVDTKYAPYDEILLLPLCLLDLTGHMKDRAWPL